MFKTAELEHIFKIIIFWVSIVEKYLHKEIWEKIGYKKVMRRINYFKTNSNYKKFNQNVFKAQFWK